MITRVDDDWNGRCCVDLNTEFPSFIVASTTRDSVAVSYPSRNWTQPGYFAYRRHSWNDGRWVVAAWDSADDDYCCVERVETSVEWKSARRWWSADCQCIVDNTSECQSQDSSLSAPTGRTCWGREWRRCFETLCCWLSYQKYFSTLRGDSFD